MFAVGALGFEFCVFAAGWRHALRSERPFIIIRVQYNELIRYGTVLPSFQGIQKRLEDDGPATLTKPTHTLTHNAQGWHVKHAA